MRNTALALFIAAALSGQTVVTTAPPAVETISATTNVAGGTIPTYYTVVARYPAGFVAPMNPAVVLASDPAQFSVSNYVTISWQPVTGATGYDVIRSSSRPVLIPCTNCAVVLNTASTTVQDTGGARSSYPPGGISPAATASGYLNLANRDEAAPYLNFSIIHRGISNTYRLPWISGSLADHGCLEYDSGFITTTGEPCGTPSAGASKFSDLSDCKVTVASSVATVTAPCRVRSGSQVFSLVTSATATLSGTSTSGTVYFGWTPGATLPYASEGTSATLTCNSFCTADTSGAFTTGSIRIASAAFTSNVFDTVTEYRSPFGADPVTNGEGLTRTEDGTSGVTELGVNTTYMAKLSTMQSGSPLHCNSTTGSMTYACSLSPTLTGYTTGMVVEFVCATTALTGAATLNIDSVGAKSIKKADGTTDPSPGDCIVGQQLPLRYDGTVFRLPNGNPAFETLTDASTITWALDYRQTTNATVTLGGSRTLNITNPVTGGSYVLRVVQDGTGSRGLTLGTGCTWKVSGGGSGAITPTTTASAIDVLAFTYDGTNCYANFNKNFN